MNIYNNLDGLGDIYWDSLKQYPADDFIRPDYEPIKPISIEDRTLTVISPILVGRKDISPEAYSLQPEQDWSYKKPLHDEEITEPKELKFKKSDWSPKQLEVLYAAIVEAKDGPIKGYRLIASKVNEFAKKGEGKSRSENACKEKIFDLRLTEKIIKRIDPFGLMNKNEIMLQMRKSITGQELEKFEKLLESPLSLQNIAIEMGRTIQTCKYTMKKHDLNRVNNHPKTIPQPVSDSDLQALMQPGYASLNVDMFFDDFEISSNVNVLRTYFDSEIGRDADERTQSVISPILSGKRKILPETVSSQPKKVKVDSKQDKQKKINWSDNQLKVLYKAIEEANDYGIIDYDLIVRKVNKFSANGDGKPHTELGCAVKISELRFSQELRMAIDPSGLMSNSEVEHRVNKPVVGPERDYLIEQYILGEPLSRIALKLKRKQSKCACIIRTLDFTKTPRQAHKNLQQEVDPVKFELMQPGYVQKKIAEIYRSIEEAETVGERNSNDSSGSPEYEWMSKVLPTRKPSDYIPSILRKKTIPPNRLSSL